MGIVTWLVLGLIAGALAKLVYPGRQGGGILATILLGILGSFVGGYIGHALLGSGAAIGTLTVPGVIFAVLGAMLLIFIWGLVTRTVA